jgi:uncharacterized membrane protein YozB (DUF420 family)
VHYCKVVTFGIMNDERSPLLAVKHEPSTNGSLLGSDPASFARRVIWIFLLCYSVLLTIYWIIRTYEDWIDDYEDSMHELYEPGETNRFEELGRKSLPIHIVTGPIAIIGGFFQFSLGLAGKGRTRLHRYWGRFLTIPLILCPLSSVGLSLASLEPRGWIECGQLLVLAAYTGLNLSFGIYFVKQKNIFLHKEFMFRMMIGLFNFVTNRIVYYCIRESSWDTAWQELATFVAAEVILCQLRKEPGWK